MSGTLFLVATPIGNLQDITLRAIETLKSVDLIACEDTRHTQKLLNYFSIKKKLISFHEHNEGQRADQLIPLLVEGKNIAVVSDAGTPGICDPSFRIVQKAQEFGIKIEPIPGAVAFVNALIISGLPTDSIFFGGFLPSKKGDRLSRFREVKNITATLCFYESPHRLAKSLADCFEVLGNRKVSIVRELTKIHEENIAGNLAELVEQNLELKGEIVLVIDREGAADITAESFSETDFLSRFNELEIRFDRKIALKKLAKEMGLSKPDVYRRLQNIKDQNAATRT